MKLQGRDLSFQMKGEDVKLLQDELKQLGYVIAPQEIRDGRFGASTRKAVLDFQKKRGMNGSGVVDQQAAREISAAVEAAQVAVSPIKPGPGQRFLTQPEVMFGNLEKIDRLPRPQADFFAAKLNEQFRKDVVAAVGLTSDAMARAVASSTAKLDYRLFADADFSAVVKEHILPAVRKNAALVKEAAAIEARLTGKASIKVRDSLRLSVPVKDNPLFGASLREAKILEYATLAGLDSATSTKLLEDDSVLDDEASLKEMVDQGILNSKQKDDLQLAIEVGKLTGDNFQFITALKDRNLATTKDFISWGKSDWEQLIRNEKLPLPPGETIQTYAENILLNIEMAYSSQALVNRLFNGNRTAGVGLLDSIKPLLRNNNRLIEGRGIAAIDWRGVSAQQRETLEKDLERLSRFANSYHHLGVAEVINDKALELNQKKKTIENRLESLDKFSKNNPNLDLRIVDLSSSKNGGLNWNDIAIPDRPRIKKQLMAYQRVLNLADATTDRETLLSAGFDSAMSITAKTEAEFAGASGLSLGMARMIYARAEEFALSVSHDFETLRDVMRGGFKDVFVSNLFPELINDLREIDGFDDLFGPQDFCDCEECRSILSPAAYFVDLMYFIEQHISKPVFITPNQTNHPLYLKNRRPDLWKLQLTCENTHTEIPFLTIVNEVLEAYLKTVVAGDIFRLLSSAAQKISFGLPFNLPLEEIRLYLTHFGITLHDVCRIIKEPEAKIWRARLNLSKEEFGVITTPDAAGVRFRFADPASFVDFDLQEFIRLAGINRQQLDELPALRFNSDLQNIKAEKQSLPDELQNFPEILKGLTPARLDFIHRFIRLWRKTGWSIPELDLVLTALKDAGLAGGTLDGNAVTRLAQLVDFKERLNLTVEELCPLVHELPVSKEFPKPPARKADARLYERLFELKKIFGEKDPVTLEVEISAPFHHYSLNTLNPADQEIDPKTPYVLAGLGVSETELLLLFDLLKNEMPFDVNGDTTLDRRRISLLYRHARLAKALKFSIEDFLQALHLNFLPANLVVTTLEQIRKLKKFADWLKSSSFSVSELRFTLRGEENSAQKYATNLETAVKMILDIQAGQEADKLAALKTRLSQSFNLTAGHRDEILKWTATDIAGAGIQGALAATFTNGVPDNPSDLIPLVALMREIERVLLVFSKLKFKDETVAYLSGKPELLGIADLKHLTLDNLKALAFYKKLIGLSETAEPSVQAVLNSYQAGHAFSSSDVAALAGLWQQDKSLVDSLASSLTFPAVAIETLEYLSECVNLCQTLGVNGFSLQKLVADANFDALIAARDVALGAFSSKYDDEKVRQEKLEPYQDQINVKKRDAVCDYIIARQRDLKFKDLHDLYVFFLLDVEMSGCFRVSRVVAAVSSLQLYIHRCLLNLEQSDPVLNPAIPDIKVDPALIPGEEWEWRKNYRVWEANRKVFLYPENYIEPDLRDNKSPLFKELEDELLQEKISQESAETAYKKYVAQLAELARLRIAGSYYHPRMSANDSSPDANTYYFFARTQQDPPQYLYRKWVDGKLWTPWEKIEIGISAPHVSAIVHLGKLYIFWVEINVREQNRVLDGTSFFEGYEYEFNFNYSALNENNKWSPPNKLGGWFTIPNPFNLDDFLSEEAKAVLEQLQNLIDGERGIFNNSGETDDSRKAAAQRIKDAEKKANEVRKEEYKKVSAQLREFEDLRKERITAVKKSFPYVPDGYLSLEYATQQPNPVLLPPIVTNAFFGRLDLFYNTLAATSLQDSPAKKFIKLVRNLLSSTGRLSFREIESWTEGKADLNLFELGTRTGLTHDFDFEVFRPSITLVHNSVRIPDRTDEESYVFTCQRQDFLLHPLALSSNGLYADLQSDRVTVRLGTTLANTLGEILFNRGLIDFLSLDTQRHTEDPLGIGFRKRHKLHPPIDDPDHLNFTGAYGEYYRELFFHVPFLIANHLNANQKFKEAKWWYERIFDPTASETPEPQKPTDRNWRYIEFRNLTIQTMKEILTDQGAIEQYKKNPFNPHAIARLRLNAYQKAIVMKYIDNLLDWGDHLFAQDTRESINEATMLYVLAADILGKRPAKLGKCETAPDKDLTYETLGPEIEEGSEFLITLENWRVVNTVSAAVGRYGMAGAHSGSSLAGSAGAIGLGGLSSSSATTTVATEIDLTGLQPRYTMRPYGDVVNIKARLDKAVKGWELAEATKRDPGIDLVRQTTLAFCVPPNYDLLRYWDQVEDRLGKIRNCLNISGVRRSLALFQPPINPMALVRARAAGLSLEDILAALGAPLPPYRFSYLIEKAKQFTQTVQSFGSALISALEKKDTEELTLLRSVQEREVLRLTQEVRKQQVMDAQHQYIAAVESKANVQNRVTYYDNLLGAGLTDWEITQQLSKHIATGLLAGETALRLTAGITYLLPQIGSPFALTYGGKETGDSQLSFSELIANLSRIGDAVSASAGLEASFQRREEEWEQQLLLAQQELKQAEQQRLAAEIRQLIAQKDLEIHEKNIEQAEELFEFYRGKFTNLGLYDYLSTKLTRLYREAYNVAYDLARMAERTYQFERDDDSIFIAGDNWQFDRAGLLAGERLLLQLQRMEKTYLEQHKRDYEVTQSFSLALLNPPALVALRETGSCEFKIDEVLFDLFYPGQYKRVTKSVRVTIPCVTGPYSNVSAKLTLLNSWLRKSDNLTTNPLSDNDKLGIAQGTSISTSSAQNDAGMFELNFRDERYLPFEGAGAISQWKLELPSRIRLFDYDTISDVIVHISYTAKDDGTFRTTIENQLVSAFQNVAATAGLYRLFSLRHDFPNAFHRLLNPTVGAVQSSEFEVTWQHFPYFLKELKDREDKDLSISELAVYLKPKAKDPIDTAGLALTLNGANVNGGWTLLPSTNLREGKVALPGSPLKKWTVAAGIDGLDKDAVEDILLLIKYTIA
ncbi:MAG: neuraminidase-like domain-containing protein [Candidatus Binatia bacterium]